MSRKRGKRRPKTANRRRIIRTREKFNNIYTGKPNEYMQEEYLKKMITSVVNNEEFPTPFTLVEEKMELFTPVFKKLTHKDLSFEEIHKTLYPDRETDQKEKRIRQKMENLVEMIETGSGGELLEFLKTNFCEQETQPNQNPFEVSKSFLQTCALLQRLMRTKHYKELTCTDNIWEVYCDLLGTKSVGLGGQVLVLEMLAFLSREYCKGIEQLHRRLRQKNQAKKRKKMKQEEEKRKKNEKSKKDEESEEDEEEEEDDEESESDEDEDEDRMKRMQQKGVIPDDDLYDFIDELRSKLCSTETLKKLSDVLYLPSCNANRVSSIYAIQTVTRMLIGSNEDKDYFDRLCVDMILTKNIDFAAHFERILEEFTAEEENEGEIDEKEEYDMNVNDEKNTIKMNKSREGMSYILTALYYLSHTNAKKVHRKLEPAYDHLIQILQNQSEKYRAWKLKFGDVSKKKKTPTSPAAKPSPALGMDWSLICAICSVVTNLLGHNPHLGRKFAECLIEDLILLVDYSNVKTIVNLEVYSCLSILLTFLTPLELRTQLDDTNLLKFVVSDLLRAKNRVDRYYPPLLCFKTIVGVFSSSRSASDNVFAMEIMMKCKKGVEKVWGIAYRICKYRKEDRKRQEARAKGKKVKDVRLTDEEMMQRNKENEFSWPCLLTIINNFWTARKKMTKIVSNGVLDTSKVERGIEQYDTFLEKLDHEEVNQLLRWSDDVSKHKKQSFSMKTVLFVFVAIICIILLFPVAYSILGFGKKLGEMEMPIDDTEEGGGDF